MPASKVSVPLTVVMRMRSKVADSGLLPDETIPDTDDETDKSPWQVHVFVAGFTHSVTSSAGSGVLPSSSHFRYAW